MNAFSILLAIGMLCIYHMDLDTLYIDLNAVDIKLDASQCNADVYKVNSFTSLRWNNFIT